MRIALLTANFPPEIFGGTEMVVAGLGNALQELGEQVVVITSSDRPHGGTQDGGVDVEEETWEGLRVLRLLRLPGEHRVTDLDRPRLLTAVRDLLGAERSEVVHVHHLAALGTGHVQKARELGLATVLTFHDLWCTCPRFFRVPVAGIECPSGSGRDSCVACIDDAVQRGPEWVGAALVERDRRIAVEVGAAQRLTAPSRTAAEQIRRHLPWEGEISIVPHGLLREPAAEEMSAPPRGDERLRIGTYGNLVAEKGVAELVTAAVGLPVELHLAGRFLAPEFEADVRGLAAERGVELVYHGEFAPRDVHPASRLHLAVFPSRCQETYGLVVDEALARGVPAVVSDRGAFAERAAQGGVVVTPLSELADTVRGLVLDRARRESLRAAVPARLPTAGDSAAHYRDFYREALEGR